MNLKKRKGIQLALLLLFLFLFFLNSISLFLYHFHHHNNSPNPFNLTSKAQTNKPYTTLTEARKILTKNRTLTSVTVNSTRYVSVKPWPILPSYLPWTNGDAGDSVKVRSCEGYFGNGFTRLIDVFNGNGQVNVTGKYNGKIDGVGKVIFAGVGGGGGGSGGWFRCWFSETLGSSICEGGRIKMDTGKIAMSRGGEELESVIGRGEEEELPRFETGAFKVDGGVDSRGGVFGRKGVKRKLVDEEFLEKFMPEGEVAKHTMRKLVDSMEIMAADEFKCDQWIEEPTLLVTRFEYANLFHTVTDWYSAYVASRVTGLPSRPHLIFMDGHCKTPLEETWRSLFASTRYAKNFNGSLCFRHMILSPLGYETALFKGLTEIIDCEGTSAHDLWQNPDASKTARLSEFGEMIRASFGFPVDRKRVIKTHNILFVRREDYLAHPRHGGKIESRLSNEEELFDSLKNWIDNNIKCKVNLVNGLFAHMPLKEQVRAIQDASVIIGAHGAGLTHIVSATPKTVILEIISANYGRPHFALISQWKGLEYHAINLPGSYAEPNVVINKFSGIMQSIGCTLAVE